MPSTIGRMARIPEKPTLEGLEERWSAIWEEAGTFRFDRSHARNEIFSIDTPPPTVSGSLHMGSAFGYVQTDSIARYQRMRGRHVFYPMGWDDNGLPTERRVQNYYGVRCDASLPYDPDFTAPTPVSERTGRFSSRHQVTSVMSPKVQIIAMPLPFAGSAREWAWTGTRTPKSGVITSEPNSGL